MSASSLVPHIENSEKNDHEVPAVTENGMVWKSPSMAIFCGGTGSGKTNCLGCRAVSKFFGGAIGLLATNVDRRRRLIHWPSEADELRLGSCVLRQATIRLWLDDFHPAVGLLTLFAAICLGLAIAVRVLLLSYNISCFGHSSSVPKARRGVPSRNDVGTPTSYSCLAGQRIDQAIRHMSFSFDTPCTVTSQSTLTTILQQATAVRPRLHRTACWYGCRLLSS
eukprot:COSAG01_NODE_4340_length_5121_cov_16.529669_2_plen_223_part_00